MVENYRPDVKHSSASTTRRCKAINPRLVYASISGFGQDGPYRDRPGFDQIAQGMGGLMSITGLPGQGPVRAGIPVADLSAGMFAAQGILSRCWSASAPARASGCRPRCCRRGGMLDFQAARWLIEGEVPGQAGNDHPTTMPTGVYPDRGRLRQHRRVAGKAISSASARRSAGRSWRAIRTMPTPAERSQNRDALNAAIAEVTRRCTTRGLDRAC